MIFKSDRTLEESLILTLFDVVNFLTKNSEAMARASGLSVQQWMVLLQIVNDSNFPRPPSRAPRAADSGAIASEIADVRGVSRPNISTLVAALLRKGLVRQKEDPGDRRRKTLHVTAKGLKALEQIEPLRRRVNADMFTGFSAGEMEAVLTFLQRWLEKLWDLDAGHAGVPKRRRDAAGARSTG